MEIERERIHKVTNHRREELVKNAIEASLSDEETEDGYIEVVDDRYDRAESNVQSSIRSVDQTGALLARLDELKEWQIEDGFKCAEPHSIRNDRSDDSDEDEDARNPQDHFAGSHRNRSVFPSNGSNRDHLAVMNSFQSGLSDDDEPRSDSIHQKLMSTPHSGRIPVRSNLHATSNLKFTPINSHRLRRNPHELIDDEDSTLNNEDISSLEESLTNSPVMDFTRTAPPPNWARKDVKGNGSHVDDVGSDDDENSKIEGSENRRERISKNNSVMLHTNKTTLDDQPIHPVEKSFEDLVIERLDGLHYQHQNIPVRAENQPEMVGKDAGNTTEEEIVRAEVDVKNNFLRKGEGHSRYKGVGSSPVFKPMKLREEVMAKKIQYATIHKISKKSSPVELTSKLNHKKMSITSKGECKRKSVEFQSKSVVDHVRSKSVEKEKNNIRGMKINNENNVKIGEKAQVELKATNGEIISKNLAMDNLADNSFADKVEKANAEHMREMEELADFEMLEDVADQPSSNRLSIHTTTKSDKKSQKLLKLRNLSTGEKNKSSENTAPEHTDQFTGEMRSTSTPKVIYKKNGVGLLNNELFDGYSSSQKEQSDKELKDERRDCPTNEFVMSDTLMNDINDFLNNQESQKGDEIVEHRPFSKSSTTKNHERASLKNYYHRNNIIESSDHSDFTDCVTDSECEEDTLVEEKENRLRKVKIQKSSEQGSKKNQLQYNDDRYPAGSNNENRSKSKKHQKEINHEKIENYKEIDFINIENNSKKIKNVNRKSSSNQKQLTTCPEDVLVSNMLLNSRLTELETEIAKFKRENENLAIRRRKFASEKQNFKNELESFEKQKVEFTKKCDEERRRLRRDKLTLDRRRNSSGRSVATGDSVEQNLKNEIEDLHGKMSKLREDLDRKQLKFNASISKLNEQMKTLDRENQILHEENHKLRLKNVSSKMTKLLHTNKVGWLNFKMTTREMLNVNQMIEIVLYSTLICTHLLIHYNQRCL